MSNGNTISSIFSFLRGGEGYILVITNSNDNN